LSRTVGRCSEPGIRSGGCSTWSEASAGCGALKGESTMSEAPNTQIIGVFHDRASVEAAIESLQSLGLERSQLTVLGSAYAIRERLGMAVGTAEADKAESAPVDESEKQNVTPLLAGVPAYVAATLAA